MAIYGCIWSSGRDCLICQNLLHCLAFVVHRWLPHLRPYIRVSAAFVKTTSAGTLVLCYSLAPIHSCQRCVRKNNERRNARSLLLTCAHSSAGRALAS